jgi:fibronectin type 3 domain-containing protein
MPTQGNGNDKSVTYAFPGYTDPTLAMSLKISYTPVPLPNPPATFTLENINYSATPSLSIDWNAIDGAIVYHVYRRAASETVPTLVATTMAPTYFDPGVDLFGTYFYSVDVVTANGQSAVSSEFQVRVIDLTLGIPAPPTGLRTTATQPDTVALAWEPVAGALFYQLFRSTEEDGVFTQLQVTPTASATDSDALRNFRSYYYRVRVVTPGGISRNSNTLIVDPRFIAGRRPARPKNLTGAFVSPFTVQLTWDASDDALGYYVYRSPRHNEEFTLVGVAETNSLVDAFALYPQNRYHYMVRAVGATGFSRHSDEVWVEPLLSNHKQVENLLRAPVAVPTPDGVLVSWRLLATDSAHTGFHIYRDGRLLNHRAIGESTNYLDVGGSIASKYEVRADDDRLDPPRSETAVALANGYLSVPLQPPPGGVTPDSVAYTYTANDASVADLDGDGVYEIILKWDPTNSKDAGIAGYTGNTFIDAYKLSGDRLWRVDFGPNIRAGSHYLPFLVYDFDGDGRAEMICRTASGTIDGSGAVIGDAAADYRDSNGYVLAGPEFLTLFDGMTGAALDTIDYIPPRGNIRDWGDSYGNRVDRFQAGVAYLDGVHPSGFFERGLYAGQVGQGAGITVVAAFDVKNQHLVNRWVFDTRTAGSQYIGQANHSVTSGDVDGDGKDEVVLGSLVLNDDGTVLYSTNLGHGDAMHLSDLDPTRPGLELFSVKEDTTKPYQTVFTDAANGNIVWAVFNGRDTGRGLAADIDPNYAGNEAWGAANLNVWSAKGEVIGQIRPPANFAIWWDGDPMRELLDDISVRKWDFAKESEVTLLDATGTASNNGTKATPCLQADLLGDWREEVVLRSVDNSELRIYSTNAVTESRIATLMHDPQYRAYVATQNTGYNQPPHPSFFIGNNMSAVAMPKVFVSPVPDFIGRRDEDGNFKTAVLVVLNVNHSRELRNEYRIDEGTWSTYREPFVLAHKGTHTVVFRTIDHTGNVLAEAARIVTIDRGKHHGHGGAYDGDCDR